MNTYFCVLLALLLGLFQSFIYKITGKYSKNFLITLSILPSLVCLVLFCVNGNIGVSVAILGVFSLVRFRSLQGNSREILNIFLSMTIGLLCSTGNLLVSFVSVILIELLIYIFYKIKYFEPNQIKRIKITVPESLDFDGIFEDILTKYCKSFKLIGVKTSNMGTLFDCTYEVEFKKNILLKDLIDDIRIKNANLNINIYDLEEENVL